VLPLILTKSGFELDIQKLAGLVKLDALDHPKTMELAARLGVELPTAIGYLELLWAFTGKKTPQGDIGKWSDAVIASSCLWRGAPSDFVQALLSARFVDTDPECRLIVHDWHEHCPNWVRAKLKKDGASFVASSDASNTGSNAPSSDTTNANSNGGTSRADLNQAKRSEDKGSRASALVLHESLPREAWSEWLLYRKGKRYPCDDLTLGKHLAVLEKYPTSGQREIIDTSINAGWQGLFAPKNGTKPVRAPNPLDPTSHIEMR
jgi:hypothetical protein